MSDEIEQEHFIDTSVARSLIEDVEPDEESFIRRA